MTSPVTTVSKNGRPQAARLSLAALTALVVGSMIGAGIYSLPQNMANAPAAPGALMVGWLITGIGMLALAATFQYLSLNAKDPEAGFHGYARDGFGHFPGFLAAWGYWISAWLGNLAYLVLIFSTLGIFFPIFGNGTNWFAIGCASILLWLYTALLLRGVREASGVNIAITIAKIIPIAVFLILAIRYFDPAIFATDFWGTGENLGSVFKQVQSMMLVTVWAFLGIEGATVYAARARSSRDVGKATIMGFALVLLLLVAVNLLSHGLMSRATLAGLPDPALAGVLRSTVGEWGAVFVGVGLIVSVSGALLAWMLMCAEILSVTGRSGAFPASLGREKRPGVPKNAIILTSVVLQVALVGTHFAGAAYYNIILMAGSMILVPYLLSAGYALKLTLAARRLAPASPAAAPSHANTPRSNSSWKLALVTTIGSTMYAIWLLYAGGVKYLLMSAVFYGVGLAVHWRTRTNSGLQPLKGSEWALAATVLLGAVVAVTGVTGGWLTI